MSAIQRLLMTRGPALATTSHVVEILVRPIGPVASTKHLRCQWPSLGTVEVPRKVYVTLGPPFRDRTSNWGIVGSASADPLGCSQFESLGTRPSTTKQEITSNCRMRGICSRRTRMMLMGWVESGVGQWSVSVAIEQHLYPRTVHSLIGRRQILLDLPMSQSSPPWLVPRSFNGLRNSIILSSSTPFASYPGISVRHGGVRTVASPKQLLNGEPRLRGVFVPSPI